MLLIRRLCKRAEYAKKLGKVKSITIDGKRELTRNVGDTTTLTAKVSPSDAPIQTCSWDSSNKAVVTVDKNTGLITAVGAGTASDYGSGRWTAVM